MARAVVEGQAFAHLAMIASDRQDERWLCDVEQAAQARSSEQLRLEISSLREGAAPGADAADAPKSALVLAQLTARGVASGAVDAAAIAAELKAQDGHVGRTVNRLMNRLRAGEHMETTGAGEAASSGTVAPEVAFMPPLHEACKMFKRELGVSGTNLVEVVDAACEMLGIADTKGANLMQKAEKCWVTIKGPTLPMGLPVA